MLHFSSHNSLCKQCGTAPRFQGHDFCGKRCAALWNPRHSSASPSPATLCETCQQRLKRVENGITHPYCGKTCALNVAVATLPRKFCKIRGCKQVRHADANGSARYCKKSHMALGKEVCLQCRSNERQKSYGQYCTPACKKDALANSPRLLKVPRDHVMFKSVVDQFNQSWRHPSPKGPPSVRRVYKVLAPDDVTNKYETYRAYVEARGNHVLTGRPAGNENRRWHGTFRECRLGEKGQTQFCNSSGCSLCCILKSSFDLSMYKRNTKWGRFGAGIYTSSTSSKANDYSRNSTQPTDLKALLLAKVVVGRGYKIKMDNPSLTAPPVGYDSVLAEVGGPLNYDEVVVYANDAVRPAYLVMYES